VVRGCERMYVRLSSLTVRLESLTYFPRIQSHPLIRSRE
jgi:hypothetical protein